MSGFLFTTTYILSIVSIILSLNQIHFDRSKYDSQWNHNTIINYILRKQEIHVVQLLCKDTKMENEFIWKISKVKNQTIVIYGKDVTPPKNTKINWITFLDDIDHYIEYVYKHTGTFNYIQDRYMNVTLCRQQFIAENITTNETLSAAIRGMPYSNIIYADMRHWHIINFNYKVNQFVKYFLAREYNTPEDIPEYNNAIIPVGIHKYHHLNIEGTLALIHQKKLENVSWNIETFSTLENMHAAANKGEIEFTLTPTFSKAYNDVMYSIPLERNDVRIIVKKRSEKMQIIKFIEILHVNVWIIIIILLFVISIGASRGQTLTSSSVAIMLLSAFANISNINIRTFNIFWKINTVIWMFLTTFLVFFFQSGALQAIFTTKFYKNIDTLDEILESKMKILIPTELEKFAPHGFKKVLIPQNTTNIFQSMALEPKDIAYAIPMSYLEMFKGFNKMVQNIDSFHVVEEVFIPTYDALYIYKYTQYNEEIDGGLKLLLNAADVNGTTEYKIRFKVNPIKNRIGWIHVKSIFVTGWAGLGLSALCLIFEIVFYYRGRIVERLKRYWPL